MNGGRRRGPMSDNERVIWMCILFPIFWPFLPVLLLCMLGEAVGRKFTDIRWRIRQRRCAHEWGLMGWCVKCGAERAADDAH